MANLLPDGWREQLNDACDRFGMLTRLGGESLTTAANERPTTVRVVTGEAIRLHVPWLWDLYAGPLLRLINEASLTPYVVDELVTSAVNINRLEGPGARYERHRDSNDLTGLLMVSEFENAAEGALRFWTDAGAIDLRCTPARFLAFDARDVVHEVLPILAGARITVPMNYYLAGTKQSKPTDILEYLYSETSATDTPNDP